MNTVFAAMIEDLKNGVENAKDNLESKLFQLQKMKRENLFEIREILSQMEEMVKSMRKNIDEILKDKIDPKEKVEWKDYTIVHVYAVEKRLDTRKAKRYFEEQGMIEDFLTESRKDFIMFKKKNNGKKALT